MTSEEPGDPTSGQEIGDESSLTAVPQPDGPAGTFSLAGRRAPGLYLIGWLATLLGLGIVVITFLGGGTGSTPWVLVVGLVLLAVGLVSAAGAQTIERTGRTDLPYRGPSPWLAFAAVIPLTLLAVLVVLGPLSAVGLDPASPFATAIGLALTALVYAGLVRLLVIGPGALTWREMAVPTDARRAVGDLLYGAAFALPVLFVTGFVGVLLQPFLEIPASPLPEAVDPLGIAANFASAAILAPIGEELFFRGFATTAWARTSPHRVAIVRGAIFFALAHVLTLFDLDQAVFAFLVRIPVGLALGWVFLARRSLAAAIGLHAVFNGLQVVALAAASSG